jgi:chemotaxis protein MotB
MKKGASTPIVIKKVRRGKAGHHGGSWKVAFADFATAMMAFFLVLWLQNNATPQQKRYISGYFKDPGGALIGPGGADSAVIDLNAPRTDSVVQQTPQGANNISEAQLEDLAAQKDQERLQALRDKLLELVQSSPSLANSKEQIHVDVVPDGVRVQIFDQENRPMFAAGSARLNPYAGKILRALAKVIRNVPNKVSITGHTDRIPYLGRPNYTNWELSADRANAARRELVAGGLPPDHIAKIEGLADSVLLDEQNPQNPINRRIAIIILRKAVSDALEEGPLTQELHDMADKLNRGSR